jgi:sialidase-1
METARISNECGIAEDWRGDLIWMIRTLSYSNGKALARVTDGGTRIVGDVYQMVDGDGVGVATSQVMSGLIQCAAVDPMKSSAPKLLLSLPNSSSARTLVTLFASYDGGRTWPIKKLVKNGPSAYSIPISIDERTIAVFWENASYTELNISIFNLRSFMGL